MPVDRDERRLFFKKRRKIIASSVVLILCFVVVLLANLVGAALRTMTNNADQLDDDRSRQATAGALDSLKDQMASTMRDNAFWDDAVKEVGINQNQDWIAENWGKTTANYPLYDTALILSPRNDVVSFYQSGEKIAEPPSNHFGKNLNLLVEKSRRLAMNGDPDPIVSTLIETSKGPALLGISPILNAGKSWVYDRDKTNTLIFSKLLDRAAIEELSNTYLIESLTLRAHPDPANLNLAISDEAGVPFYYLSWPRQQPGTIAYQQVRPLLFFAFCVLVLFLVFLLGFGYFSIRGISSDEERARYDAVHDRLSGLWNRAGLYRNLDKAIKLATTTSLNVSFLYADLDGFKEVNDTFGHTMGDKLICAVSSRLSALAAEQDLGEAIVHRVGGDEFALLIGDDPDGAIAKRLADAILATLVEPFSIEDRVMSVGASIGIARSITGETEGAEIIRRADLSMYRAKETGRSRAVTYERGLDTEREMQTAIEGDLRKAIENDEIEVEFQPLVDAKTGRIIGVEALARWVRPEYGPVPPDVFIPIAERTGTIEALGLRVMHRSFTAVKAWPDMRISINVSPAQFRNPLFPQNVEEILIETGIAPHLVTLELTEGYFISQPKRATNAMLALKALGVNIALEDFGSAFSSLGYLRRFAFDRIKVDRSLIAALDREANAGEVIMATIALANALNIPVTAEGIEREDQASIMRLSGCDELQGYLFGRAMSAAELSRLVTEQGQGTYVSAQSRSSAA